MEEDDRHMSTDRKAAGAPEMGWGERSRRKGPTLGLEARSGARRVRVKLARGRLKREWPGATSAPTRQGLGWREGTQLWVTGTGWSRGSLELHGRVGRVLAELQGSETPGAQ